MIIENFKSIEKIEIPLEDNYHVLIGQNESGKSSILEALSYIDKPPGTVIEETYVKETDEGVLEPARITFFYEKDGEEICFEYSSKNQAEEKENSGKNSEAVVEDDDSDEEKDQVRNKEEVVPDTGCIYWGDNTENFLPVKIAFNKFEKDPESCRPLKYLFHLGGILDIQCELENKNHTQIQNVFNRVSRTASDFFKTKWEAFGNFSFDLDYDDKNIYIGIKEKNLFTFEQRSSGFKKFITFLIMLSAQTESGQLKNSVLLIDEPENSLEPRAQKALLRELRKLSQTHKIIFSTHSVFMIDPDNLSNHYIVKKENETTRLITKTLESTLLDSESYYNVLGFSIFDDLKKKNILFEGWTDKKLFKTALKKKDNPELREIFNGVGITHDKGVSPEKIRSLLGILELGGRECLMISDSDQEAQKSRKKFEEEFCLNHEFKWTAYGDFVKDIETVEDFLKDDFLAKEFKNVINHPSKKDWEENKRLKKIHPDFLLNWEKISKEKLKELIDDFSFSGEKGKLQQIATHLNEKFKKLCSDLEIKAEGIDTLIKWLQDKFKHEAFPRLKPENIEDRYFAFLEDLGKKYF